jgi:REG-2-like HAD superfamily hydrolase
LTPEQWWFEVVKQTYLTTERLTNIDAEEINQLMPVVFKKLFYDVFGTRQGWTIKEDAVYTLDKLRDWRDQGAGPKLGIISNNDNRLNAVLQDLGLSQYFDFVLTSYDVKSAKPDRAVFDAACRKMKVQTAAACYHVGEVVNVDVAGAAAAGWTAIRINENFDQDFPDWFAVDSEAQAAQGAEKRLELMNWGRRDVEKEMEWVEIWGLDDILQLFGFPEDLEKPIKTTYIRNFLDDE